MSKKYTHYKNNKVYTTTGKCLIQVDGQWKEAVLYREEFGNQLFCRELKEFLEKFKMNKEELESQISWMEEDLKEQLRELLEE